jgi:lysophospholipase L1-like esterase
MRILVLLSLTVLFSSFAADPNSPLELASYKEKVKIACVGDSITAGPYPGQLQKLLGEKFMVKNFGNSGSTLLKHGDKPYDKQKSYTDALAFKGDAVVIMLGTNDTKPQNWGKHKDEFVADYKALLAEFAKAENKPRIFVATPPFVPGKGNYGINEAGVLEELPMIEALAKEAGVGIIDQHAATKDKDELFPDRVHPNAAGAGVLASTVYKALLGKAPEGK